MHARHCSLLAHPWVTPADLDKAIPQVEDRSSQAQQPRGSGSPQFSRSSPRDVRRENIKKTEVLLLGIPL